MRPLPLLRAGRPASLLGCVICLCLGWAVAGAGSAAAAPTPFLTGVSNVYSNDAAAFQDVKKAGGTLVLSPLRWDVIAPAQEPAIWNPEDPADPHYEWSFFDDWVRRAVAAGLTPILDVRSAPRWAQGCTPTGEAICKPDPAALAAFTRAAVRRYGGNFGGLPWVRYWQGLNEPNLSLFLEPQYENGILVSPDIYRTLANTFYAAVKSVMPSNIVMMAGLGPIAVSRYTIGPIQFTKRLLCMGGTNRNPRPLPGDCGGGVHFDIFDIHPYTTGGPTHKGGANDVEMGDLGKLQTLLRAADRAGRIDGIYRHTPLWVTEFGWDSKPPDPGGLPMRIEQQWVSEALYEAWRAGVDNFLWYSLADFPPEPNIPFSESLQTGLFFYSADVSREQPKPVMYSFRFPFVAIRKGSVLTVWGRTPNGAAGRIAVQAHLGHRWRTIGTIRSNAVGVFQGRLRTAYGRNRKGAVRAVVRGQRSVPFPMRRVPDFRHAPFGDSP